MKTLFTFNNAPDVEPWYTENDVVMGGVSSSQITHIEEEGIGGVARFTGNVSLENDGGFAQISYDQETMDLTGFEGIELHVQGDNQTYQLRLETDAKQVTYAHSFKTTDKWQHIQLSFADFEPTHHGEPVPDAPELNLSNVSIISFLIGDEQEGEFEILIDEMRAYE